MSWLGDEWDKVKNGAADEWHKLTDWARGVKHEVTSTVQNGQQRASDAYNDAKHPVYSAIEMGLTAVFGKQAMKWLVDTLLGFFGKKGGSNVQSFGSGDFTETLERWQRELNRDLGTTSPAPQAKPTPT